MEIVILIALLAALAVVAVSFGYISGGPKRRKMDRVPPPPITAQQMRSLPSETFASPQAPPADNPSMIDVVTDQPLQNKYCRPEATPVSVTDCENELWYDSGRYFIPSSLNKRYKCHL